MTDDAPVPARTHLDTALTTANSGRARGRIGAAIATGTTVYHLARQIHSQVDGWQQRRHYSVTVTEGDEVYTVVQRWVMERMPEVDQHAVTAHTRRIKPVSDDDQDDDFSPVSAREAKRARRVIDLHYDGSRSQKVVLDGHAVDVRVEREAPTGSPQENAYRVKPHKVIFVARDLAGRAAVVRFLQEVADSLAAGKKMPRLFTAARWGDWTSTRDLTPRRLDSVFLPEGHLDEVMDDLRRFLASEDRYGHLGVPWHRGYLFSGTPGTGKSTTAAAMGTELGLDVFHLSVADIQSNATLTSLIGNVPPRSMLLLEDIDVVKAAQDRDVTGGEQDGEGVSLDGLLNALDGVVTPHGLVTVMTTNRRDALDDALVRPGRADMELEMGPLTPETFGRVVEYFTGLPCRLGYEYDADLGAGAPWPAVTPAQVVGVCVKNLYDGEAARKAALRLLDELADASAPLG